MNATGTQSMAVPAKLGAVALAMSVSNTATATPEGRASVFGGLVTAATGLFTGVTWPTVVGVIATLIGLWFGWRKHVREEREQQLNERERKLRMAVLASQLPTDTNDGS
jgi:hypothetical protein